MPHVVSMTEAELAERAGESLDLVRRLSGLGVIAPDETGSFRPSDIQRVRLAEAIERSGIDLQDLARAMADGHLSLSFLDLMLSRPVARTDQTYLQLCAQMGWDFAFVELLQEAMGLPQPGPDERIREDDARMFPIAQFVRATGITDAQIARSLRVYADNLARIAQAEAQFFHSYVEVPLQQSGMSELEMLSTAAQLSPQLQRMVDELVAWLYHRHQEHYIIEHVVEHVEAALEEAGVRAARPPRPAAMVFLDLTGYTRLTEERGDEAAAELAMTLAGLVQRESRRYGGGPVKHLGDGVMFHFPEALQAVRCSLDLVDAASSEGMPPAHVGVNAGPVVFRDGDYFGRTVNVAARIAARAGPREVLVSQDAVAAGSGEGVAFEEVGPARLKNVREPVLLFRARRSPASAG